MNLNFLVVVGVIFKVDSQARRQNIPTQPAWFQPYPNFPVSAFTEKKKKKSQLNIEHFE